MKNITIIVVLFLTLGCKAQTPVLDIYNPNIDFGNINNAYNKDVNNLLEPYIGSWLYTNGTTSLKIILQKRVMYHRLSNNQSLYTDYIIGGYKYIENGVTILNCLNDLTLVKQFIFDYDLYGNILLSKTNIPSCADCAVNEKRLDLTYNEPLTRNDISLSADMILRPITENGIQKIKLLFYLRSLSLGMHVDGTPTNIEQHSIPYGEYILTKQL